MREFGALEVALRPIPTYPDSVVYALRSDERTLVFKGVDPVGEDPDRIAVEAWAIEAAHSAGVPVPAVVRVDVSAEVFPSSYFLMEEVQGVPLESVESSQDGYARALVHCGELLRRLHNVATSGYGLVSEAPSAKDRSARGEWESWAEALTRAVPQAIEYLASHALTVGEIERLRSSVAMSAAEIPLRVEPVLLHSDYGSSHVFVHPETLAVKGIVDFGECGAGDWIWDLCEWDLASTEMILRGYGVEAGAVGTIYGQLRHYLLLKAVPWAAKWHRRGEPQVLDWLRRLIFPDRC